MVAMIYKVNTMVYMDMFRYKIKSQIDYIWNGNVGKQLVLFIKIMLITEMLVIMICLYGF